MKTILTTLCVLFCIGTMSAQLDNLLENFETVSSSSPTDWIQENKSPSTGLTDWFQGNTSVFKSLENTDDYLGANYNNCAGADTISNWILTPELTLENGAIMKFWTRKPTGSTWADRLQVRMSTNGVSEEIGDYAISEGDFTELLLDINPNLNNDDYPTSWTEYSITISGLASTTTGRLAFRYYVTDAGPSGSNSDYIGIDSFTYLRCYFADDLTATNVQSSSAELSWTNEGPATSWNIEYGPSGYTQGSGTSVLGVTNPYTLTGLNTETEYDYYVQSDCGTSESTWAGPYTFTTLAFVCSAPSELDATNITASSAELSWLETGTATTWNIEWGVTGFTQGAGTMETGLTTNPYTLSGLSADLVYDYYVQADCDMDGTSTWRGPFSFSTVLNDDCENAKLVACNNVITGSTAYATTWDGGALTCGSGGDPEAEVWFYIEGADEEITFLLCNSDYDTRLDVYQSETDCSGLVCLTGNDDQCGTDGLQSAVTFNGYAGIRYYVAVHGSSAATGNYSLQVNCFTLCEPLPVNDDCDNATTLIIDTPLTGETNQCALNATTNPSCDPNGMIQDVWYTFNSGTNTDLYLQILAKSAPEMEAAIYDGCRGSELFCSDDGEGGENLELTGLTENTDYYIQVWSQKPEEGQFDIRLTTTPNIYIGTGACEADIATATVDGTGGTGVWVDFYAADGSIVGSIENTQDLGTVSMSIQDHALTPSTEHFHYLPRYWYVSSSAYPNSVAFPANVKIRLYFFETEFQALVSATNSNRITSPIYGPEMQVTAPMDLRLTHASGNSVDNCTPVNNDGTVVQVMGPVSSYLNGFYAETSVGSFSEFGVAGINGGNPILPIELTRFEGTAEASSNVLSWETATEIDNDYFEVLRSSNGFDFSMIGIVKGSGSTSTNTAYTFEDKTPIDLAYYQLKQVDFDEKTTYSTVITLKRATASTTNSVVSIYPNPTNGLVNLSIETTEVKELTIRVLDMTGKEFQYLNYTTMDGGNNIIPLDLEHMTSGMYYVSVNDGFSVVTHKVVLTKR